MKKLVKTEVEFLDMRHPDNAMQIAFDYFGAQFILSVIGGKAKCLLCGEYITLLGKRDFTVYARFEGKSPKGERAMINVGCCLECFEKHETFENTTWVMAEFIQLSSGKEKKETHPSQSGSPPKTQ